MTVLMNTEKLLEKYILEHPDYWEFENELREVAKLKELCKGEAIKQNRRICVLLG